MRNRKSMIAGLGLTVWFSLTPISGLAQQSPAEKEFAFAQQLLDDRLFSLAAEQFGEFAGKFPNHELADDALFQGGKALFEHEQYNLAFDTFRNLEIRYSTSQLLPEARHLLARCQMKAGKFPEAAKLFERIPLLHPNTNWARAAWLSAGQAHFKNGDSRSATAAFLRLIDDYPESKERLDAHLEIVHLYLNKGNYSDALAQIDGVFRVYGRELDDPRVHYVRAFTLQAMGQQEGALSGYKELIEKFPSETETSSAHFQLGQIYSGRKEYKEALTHYEQCLSGSTDVDLTLRAHLAKGDLFFAQEDFEASLASYQQAAPEQQAARTAQVDFKLGKAFSRLDRHAESVPHFEKVIARGKEASGSDTAPPDLVNRAYFELKDALLRSGQHRDALTKVSDYLRNFERSSEYSKMAFAKAEILENHAKDFPRALRSYDEFLESFPHSRQVDEAQLAIGRCYELLGEYTVAMTEYDRYLTAFPAGDRYHWVKTRRRIIAETVAMETGKGLANMADVIANYNEHQKSGTLPLELGKLYLAIKDFKRAIPQFKNILAKSQHEPVKDESYFLLGQAYLRFADYQTLFNQGEHAQTYRDSATVVFNYLTGKQSQSKWAAQAHFSLTKLRLDTMNVSSVSLEELSALKTEWQARFPKGEGLDLILIRIADWLLQAGSAEDTLKTQQALDHLETLITKYPASDYREDARLNECLAYSKLGLDSLANVKLASFLSEFPRSQLRPQALFLQAELSLRAQNIARAMDSLRRVATDYYYSEMATQANLRMAEIEYGTGNFQSAVDHYRAADSLGQNGAVANMSDASGYPNALKLAKALENLGDYSGALDHYVDFIQLQPKHERAPEARLAVAEIATDQNRTTFAKEYYQSILASESSKTYKYQATAALGDIAFDEKRYKQANTYYLSALRLATDEKQEEYSTRQAIRCKYRLMQFAAADADVKQFKRRFKESKAAEAQFLDDRGHAHIEAKNFPEAEKTFKKLKDDFKDTEYGPKGEFGLGEVYLITNKTEDALKILTDIPSRHPESEVTPLTFFNLGDFYYKSQQVQNAISAFKSVLAHPRGDKYHRTALLYLTQCYEDLRLWDQAISLTRQYLEKYPNDNEAFRRRIKLAKFLKELKEFNRAIEHFSKLLPYADNEGAAEIQFSIAECYQDMGSFERAAAEFLKVKYTTNPTKLPWRVTALIRASDCFTRVGGVDQARQILQRIIDERGAGDQFGSFARKKLEELEKDQNGQVHKDGS